MTDTGALRVLAGLLEARTGQVIGPGREWRLEATLKPLLRERGIDSLEVLAATVAGTADPALADAVVDALLNNETSFFRDAVAFQVLNDALVERLRARAPAARRQRIWCAGCSSGQEAYSLAMLGHELAAALPGTVFDILGTDVSATAVTRARRGVYSQFEVQRGLPVRKLVRWFDKHGGDGWEARRELRRGVRFERAKLDDPLPGGGFDLILCRNVLLYFSPDQRRDLFEVLAGALAPDGALMLGAGETTLSITERFVPDPDHRGLYRHAPEALRHATL